MIILTISKFFDSVYFAPGVILPFQPYPDFSRNNTEFMTLAVYGEAGREGSDHSCCASGRQFDSLQLLWLCY